MEGAAGALTTHTRQAYASYGGGSEKLTAPARPQGWKRKFSAVCRSSVSAVGSSNAGGEARPPGLLGMLGARLSSEAGVATTKSRKSANVPRRFLYLPGPVQIRIKPEVAEAIMEVEHGYDTVREDAMIKYVADTSRAGKPSQILITFFCRIS